MDITGISRLVAATSQGQTGDAVGILTLKKAIQIEGQLALQLLEALPQPPSNPPNLGQSVDAMA